MGESASSPSPGYQAVQKRLAQGWNTWDVNSAITQVLLPDGLAVHVGLQSKSVDGAEAFLSNVFPGGQSPGGADAFPGPHTWDGSYTDLRLSWKGHKLRVESAHDGDNLVILATPLATQSSYGTPPAIVISVDYLWNRVGTVDATANSIPAQGPRRTIEIYCTRRETAASATDFDHPDRDGAGINAPVAGPLFAEKLNAPVGVSTGRPRSLAQIRTIVERQRLAYERSISAAGKAAPSMGAIETILGWNTIYEPEGGRVISPVSRIWSVRTGGYVIFEWDTFFAATLAAVGDRDLAYANAMETLRGETRDGFVPNYVLAGGRKSADRSQPPIGAMTVLGLYKKFHDRWLLEDAFAPLLRWNRWWPEHRDTDGYLTWGSDLENQSENTGPFGGGTRQAAVYESGMDNSPMYDGAFYNKQTHLLEYADVGLMSMYIADCDALATMATILNKPAEAKELRGRSARYRAKLATMWSPKLGIFLNKDLNTGQFNTRLSPTNFYPLLAKAASPEQADRMIHEHLLNPNEFWGKWVIPSIERSDPAFKEQGYWRGRIWGPMNYLVYLGIRNYNYPDVCQDIAKKSADLFFQDWDVKGHVHENYNAITGDGDIPGSDRFYNWGALLALVEYMQQTQSPVHSQANQKAH